MNGIVLVGAGGLAREVMAASPGAVVGIVDDDPRRHGTTVGGVPVLGAVREVVHRPEQVLVCIGPSAVRRDVVRSLESAGLSADRHATFVAASARIGAGCTVGAGSIVLDGVVMTADAALGRHVVVMPNTVVTHDDEVADFATLAAGVALGGGVRIGEAAYVGMNAAIRQGIAVGDGATVGMGAVVLSDVPAQQTWAGVPARPLGVFA
ncbi:NeuD/PglB/VioB family sugar acetyltransferase [Microbacterium sp. EYE_5]|uniref:NeuD/PglB/VioB family sugar acetyltransferase n=1 Tax=unclassified Microbacterium TaxID=2609290 RepID=UPI0020038AB9|nr:MULTISPECIES: NeuD/PglB/VioB family sugar acetyltransferase [unclassified Microbacterium]MCK6079854.1 NeuD/PglB/VioB family sugar acetyltransferase [Microbacterium sp. EYE_382]MCK6085125.1 NeuD/PglB/VioB family sugar acetyltransferase [Microbacterium sp. EYE_384]MCK6122649.1 NeuD/PglB/VioB family sugar acetyltransferase [Microbacterium sp. EYE_80]MCK6125888.1 NeuD/PglB/VioB family sugar acetyltransferase [Microbacterium sp. EYE_79]MCK6140809.1 NeuD/PglB/VioB family sugar acetyltransferase [